MNQDEIVKCAVECFEAGADGAHAHLRDENGEHLQETEANVKTISHRVRTDWS